MLPPPQAFIKLCLAAAGHQENPQPENKETLTSANEFTQLGAGPAWPRRGPQAGSICER